MSTEKPPSNGSRLFLSNDTPARGITSAYRTGEGLYGHTPRYHKEHDTLWQGWDKALADPDNPGAKTYEAKRREGEARDQRIHAKPVSKLHVDQLKAERAKPQAQSHLTPNGPGAAHVRSAKESERERKIHFQEKRLDRQQGAAQQGFNPASKAQKRGPIRGPER
jgi:hypothetical protein